MEKVKNKFYLYKKRNEYFYEIYSFPNEKLKFCKKSQFIIGKQNLLRIKKYEKNHSNFDTKFKIFVSCSFEQLKGKKEWKKKLNYLKTFLIFLKLEIKAEFTNSNNKFSYSYSKLFENYKSSIFFVSKTFGVFPALFADFGHSYRKSRETCKRICQMTSFKFYLKTCQTEELINKIKNYTENVCFMDGKKIFSFYCKKNMNLKRKSLIHLKPVCLGRSEYIRIEKKLFIF